jgi:hypothetical protein
MEYKIRRCLGRAGKLGEAIHSHQRSDEYAKWCLDMYSDDALNSA